MHHGRDYQRHASVMAFNATPMVDVIFLLTIFFMLVARFSSAEQLPMELPDPQASRAKIVKMPERVVINCRLAEPDDPSGASVLYHVGPNLPVPLAVIGERLAAMKRESPELKVVIRADRRLRYADVRAVMRVIADSGIDLLNVAAHVGEEW